MSHVLVNPDKTKWNTQWSRNEKENRSRNKSKGQQYNWAIKQIQIT